MSFDVTADAYLRFMGRFSEPLAERFANWGGVAAGQRVLDVGCGTGALTQQLVERAGPEKVAAVDPSESFIDAMRARFPGVDVRLAGAESLPFADDEFDAVLAQLVIHLVPDAAAAVREMARVTRAGGVVAACVWDHAGDRGPLATFWRAARELDPGEDGEATLAGMRDGDLARGVDRGGTGGRRVVESDVGAALRVVRGVVAAVPARCGASGGVRWRAADCETGRPEGAVRRAAARDIL